MRQTKDGERRERVDLIGMSDHGLSFRSVSQLATNDTVRITDRSSASFEAIVRHCQPDGDGYTVGVQVVREVQDESDSAPAAGAGPQPD